MAGFGSSSKRHSIDGPEPPRLDPSNVPSALRPPQVPPKQPLDAPDNNQRGPSQDPRLYQNFPIRTSQRPMSVQMSSNGVPLVPSALKPGGYRYDRALDTIPQGQQASAAKVYQAYRPYRPPGGSGISTTGSQTMGSQQDGAGSLPSSTPRPGLPHSVSLQQLGSAPPQPKIQRTNTLPADLPALPFMGADPTRQQFPNQASQSEPSSGHQAPTASSSSLTPASSHQPQYPQQHSTGNGYTTAGGVPGVSASFGSLASRSNVPSQASPNSSAITTQSSTPDSQPPSIASTHRASLSGASTGPLVQHDLAQASTPPPNHPNQGSSSHMSASGHRQTVSGALPVLHSRESSIQSQTSQPPVQTGPVQDVKHTFSQWSSGSGHEHGTQVQGIPLAQQGLPQSNPPATTQASVTQPAPFASTSIASQSSISLVPQPSPPKPTSQHPVPTHGHASHGSSSMHPSATTGAAPMSFTTIPRQGQAHGSTGPSSSGPQHSTHSVSVKQQQPAFGQPSSIREAPSNMQTGMGSQYPPQSFQSVGTQGTFPPYQNPTTFPRNPAVTQQPLAPSQPPSSTHQADLPPQQAQPGYYKPGFQQLPAPQQSSQAPTAQAGFGPNQGAPPGQVPQPFYAQKPHITWTYNPPGTPQTTMPGQMGIQPIQQQHFHAQPHHSTSLGPTTQPGQVPNQHQPQFSVPQAAPNNSGAAKPGVFSSAMTRLSGVLSQQTGMVYRQANMPQWQPQGQQQPPPQSHPSVPPSQFGSVAQSQSNTLQANMMIPSQGSSSQPQPGMDAIPQGSVWQSPEPLQQLATAQPTTPLNAPPAVPVSQPTPPPESSRSSTPSKERRSSWLGKMKKTSISDGSPAQSSNNTTTNRQGQTPSPGPTRNKLQKSGGPPIPQSQLPAGPDIHSIDQATIPFPVISRRFSADGQQALPSRQRASSAVQSGAPSSSSSSEIQRTMSLQQQHPRGAHKLRKEPPLRQQLHQQQGQQQASMPPLQGQTQKPQQQPVDVSQNQPQTISQISSQTQWQSQQPYNSSNKLNQAQVEPEQQRRPSMACGSQPQTIGQTTSQLQWQLQQHSVNTSFNQPRPEQSLPQQQPAFPQFQYKPQPFFQLEKQQQNFHDGTAQSHGQRPPQPTVPRPQSQYQQQQQQQQQQQRNFNNAATQSRTQPPSEQYAANVGDMVMRHAQDETQDQGHRQSQTYLAPGSLPVPAPTPSPTPSGLSATSDSGGDRGVHGAVSPNTSTTQLKHVGGDAISTDSDSNVTTGSISSTGNNISGSGAEGVGIFQHQGLTSARDARTMSISTVSSWGDGVDTGGDVTATQNVTSSPPPQSVARFSTLAPPVAAPASLGFPPISVSSAPTPTPSAPVNAAAQMKANFDTLDPSPSLYIAPLTIAKATKAAPVTSKTPTAVVTTTPKQEEMANDDDNSSIMGDDSAFSFVSGKNRNGEVNNDNGDNGYRMGETTGVGGTAVAVNKNVDVPVKRMATVDRWAAAGAGYDYDGAGWGDSDEEAYVDEWS